MKTCPNMATFLLLEVPTYAVNYNEKKTILNFKI